MIKIQFKLHVHLNSRLLRETTKITITHVAQFLPIELKHKIDNRKMIQ